MKRSLLVIVSAVFVSGLIFSGYAEPAAKKTEILVGAINSMTGAEAMVGGEHRWAYEQAVNDINAKGGVNVKDLGKRLPLKLVVMDDKSSIPEAAAACEKLIKLSKVDFIFGSVSTELNVSGISVAEKYKKIYVTTTFWPEEHLAQKVSWVATSFFYAGKLVESPASILDTMPENERPKKIAVMAMDNPDGQAFAGGAKAMIGPHGYEVVLEPYTEGTRDYSGSILRLKREGVDALVWLGSPADGITLIRQIKENKYNLKFIWGAKGFWPVEFMEALGPDSDYMVSDGHWAEALGYGISKELGDRFRAKFGKGRSSVTVGNFYSIVQALAQAIEQAGSVDSTKVRDVFYSGTFVAKNTTNGDLAFNDKGLAEIPPVGLQWWKGERKPVYPPDPNVWTLKWLPPWDERK